jgi:hypothetical protein
MRHPSVSRRRYCVMCAVPTSTGASRGDDQQDRSCHGRSRRGRGCVDDRVQRQVKGARRLGPPHLREAAAEGLAAAVRALVAVKDRVAGEEREIAGRISGAGGGVGAGEQVKDVEPVGNGQGHRPAAVSGRSQRWT